MPGPPRIKWSTMCIRTGQIIPESNGQQCVLGLAKSSQGLPESQVQKQRVDENQGRGEELNYFASPGRLPYHWGQFGIGMIEDDRLRTKESHR